MSIESASLDRMRDDWKTVAKHRRATGDWTESDEVEIAREVKAAVAAGAVDDGLLACWRLWLAGEAEEIRRWSARVRDVEARIKAEAVAARERKAA